MGESRQRASSGRRRARRFLVQALYQWQVSGEDPGDVLIQFVDGRNLGNADIEYFRELMRAIPADVEALDALIAPLLERSVAMIDPVERGILRLACHELRDRLEVPGRVVIDESVELAKAFGAEQGHRFVNGVVDRLARRLRPREFGHTG
ncbi:MAG: transcription antitermination factor NusB [Halofilum sp. (in: g-proteobacteria)]